MEILEELWRNKGLTLIMVTHDSNVAKRAKRNLNIANGRVSAR
jgi:putative ABC transport system ATP-binding protein